MSNIRQNTTFEKIGLNSDDNHAYMPNGSSPYNLNILIGEDGNQGIVTNGKGNKLITYDQPLTLSKCYETLGSYYNNLTRKAYFFVFSQPYLDNTDPSPYEYLYDNRLLCFNEDLLTIDTVFLDIHNYFELDPAQYLTNIKMLGPWLFFNPITAQPKMIDVDMAYNYTNYLAWDDTDASAHANLGDTYTWKGGLFVANTTITAFEDPSTANTKWDRIGDSYQDESALDITEFNRAFFAIKIPPTDRIVVSFGSDSTKNFNEVRDRVFRFCHRYQYFDDTYSVCSSHSELSLAKDDELYNGKMQSNIKVNNYIKLSFGLYSPSLVKNIEIFFQEIEGDWKRLAIVNRQEQSLLDKNAYVLNFYNNETYSVIDQRIPYVIHDAVPDRVSSQEIINKNVLCYARCREGKPNIDKDLIDVTLIPVKEQITEVSGISALKRDNIASNDWTDVSYVLEGRVSPFSHLDIVGWYSITTLASQDVYLVNINNKILSYTIQTADIVNIGTFVIALKAFFYANFPELSLRSDNTTMIELGQRAVRPTIITSKFYTSTGVTQDAFTKKRGFKTGAYHPFCFFYYDEALRRGDAQLTSETNVYVPTLNETSPHVVTTDYRYLINWAISHKPPSWAKYWRWGYAGNRKCSKFVQYIISSVENTAPPDPSAPFDMANAVKIDITPLQTIRTTTTANWNSFPNSIIPQYDFAIGDRIRFITKGTDDPSFSGDFLNDIIVGTYDFEIIASDPLTNMIYINGRLTDIPNIGVNSLVEIYTPISDASSLDPLKTLTYFEFGDLMEIKEDVDGNLVHCGASAAQDQELGVSPVAATGTFYTGDVYHIRRTPSKPLSTDTFIETSNSVFHESMWWSDFYKSDDWDKGKLGLESPIGEVTLNIIRYSNTYLQNTTVNGITTFEADHYKELNDVFGKIISIVEVGDTLKCYQEKKPSSILVGRTEYQDDGSGKGNVVISSAVLGAIRYSNTNYGTTFPESISKNNRYVYGFDIYNGVIWRDSANGIFPISGRYSDIGASVDYKMQSYFKAKSKLLLASGVKHCQVLTVWDEEYKMLYVSFKDTVNEVNNETVVFHEPSDRWITFTEFECTPIGGYNQILELTYDVVKGFENGIGYEFDLLTRFAKFNIGGGLGTAAKINLTPLSVRIIMSLPNPVVTIINIPLAPRARESTYQNTKGFTANWDASAKTEAYKIDVSLSSNFTSFIPGYQDKYLGNVLSLVIADFPEAYDYSYYYYRVRAYNEQGTSVDSNVITAYTTAAIPPIALSVTSQHITIVGTDGATIRTSASIVSTMSRDFGIPRINYHYNTNGKAYHDVYQYDQNVVANTTIAISYSPLPFSDLDEGSNYIIVYVNLQVYRDGVYTTVASGNYGKAITVHIV